MMIWSCSNDNGIFRLGFFLIFVESENTGTDIANGSIC